MSRTDDLLPAPVSIFTTLSAGWGGLSGGLGLVLGAGAGLGSVMTAPSAGGDLRTLLGLLAGSFAISPVQQHDQQ